LLQQWLSSVFLVLTEANQLKKQSLNDDASLGCHKRYKNIFNIMEATVQRRVNTGNFLSIADDV
jgi:hypothetical protein